MKARKLVEKIVKGNARGGLIQGGRLTGVAGEFGRKYFQDVVRRDDKPAELWAALAENGFLGVHIPVEDGGGGGGLADYNVVIEETAAQGCPVLGNGGSVTVLEAIEM